MPTPPNPAPAARASRRFLWLAWAALAAFAVFLALRTTSAAGGSDSSGYLNHARMLADGHSRVPLRLPPELGAPGDQGTNHFVPLGFVAAADPAAVVPTYPTGLPLHFALAARIFGWDFGPKLVLVLAALAAVWLCYLAARELGLAPALAAAGAAMLAVFPVFLFCSIQALSDTLATAWCIAAVLCALRAPRGGRWAAACGAAFSVAVLVRPTNVFLAPALALLLGADFRRLALFGLAGLPAAAWQLLYNHHQYGGPFETGYGDFLSAFSVVYGWPTFLHFAQWLGAFLPPFALLLPFAALAHPATRDRRLAGLGLAFTLIAGFYLFYDVSHDVWWCLRFILPVVPALILGALLGVEALARGPGARWPRAFRPVSAAILAGWAVAASWYWSPGLHVFMVQVYEQNYEDAARLAARELPPDALVAACLFSGSLYYYTDRAVLRSDVVEAPDFARYAARTRAAGRPLCAVVFDFEEEELNRRCPGRWTRFGGYANVGFWRLEP